MKIFLSFVLLIFGIFANAQTYVEKINAYQKELNESFKDTVHSPLLKEEIASFDHLDFFPISENYQVKAKFIKKRGKKFEMMTSTDRKPIYRSVGTLHFVLNQETLVLTVYKNIKLSKNKAYKNYLFIPFKDLTNGTESYGGGRYLDIQKPEKGQRWVLDFNKCYNPYCAYNHNYSCPIPPRENHLKVKIEAGVKVYH